MVDMLGNVREFCLDWYAPDAYSHLSGEATDPRGPESGKEHVVRGGSYLTDAADLRCAARDHTREDDWLLTDPQSPKSIWWYSDVTDVGFRVVREVDAGVQAAVK
jgi:formylglycine-generating enzyme required for sulfatase activity